MKIVLDDSEYFIDPSSAIDISIPLKFGGSQPNAYGVEPATSTACEYGSLVGDTRRGGSCNFERVTIIPHCNGTHTECVGHITDERISVRECLEDVFVHAVLVSIGPEHEAGELIITRDALTAARLASGDARSPGALVVRTLPNDEAKLSRSYHEHDVPPYFSADAMKYIVQCGYKHLLVDLPSIDRLVDAGRLANHRIFWNVEMGSHEVNSATRLHSTITELIYVPDEIPDGDYLLNLQIAPWEADAVPSRPILFKRI